MVYKRGKHGIYSYRFRFAGRMIHESARTTSKTLAREAERRRRRELEERVNGIAKKRSLPPTFERAAREWMTSREHTVAMNTQVIARSALKHLLPVFGATLLCDITPEDIARYQKMRLQSGVEGRTVNIEVGTLRQVLKVNDMWLPLAGKVRKLRERHDIGKALSLEQEHALLAAAARTDSACYTATVLALNSTMRSQEIKSLRWEQIDFVRRELIVGHSKTDAGTGRLIPLNPTALEALIHWSSRRPSADPKHYVFPRCESRQVDPTRPTKGWRTAWRNALKRAGFRCRFHDLRHSAITKLAEGQASDATILAIAGHTSRAMMERYSHIRTAAKRAALDSIAQGPKRAISEDGVHQNVNQIQSRNSAKSAKLLN